MTKKHISHYLSWLFLFAVIPFKVHGEEAKVYLKVKNTLTNEIKTFEHNGGNKDYKLSKLTCWVNTKKFNKDVLISCASPNPEGKKLASQVIPRIYARCAPDVANVTLITPTVDKRR